jgi:hypothetical protein
MVQRCWGYTYEQGGLRVRVGEERGGKEMDGCPLTLSGGSLVLQLCSIAQIAHLDIGTDVS